jgi:hypothetical protein
MVNVTGLTIFPVHHLNVTLQNQRDEEIRTGKGYLPHHCQIDGKNGGFHSGKLFAETKSFNRIAFSTLKSNKVKALKN